MLERVPPRTRLERHGNRRAEAQAHVEEYFTPEPLEIPEPIKPSRWGKLTKYAVWEDFLEVRRATELRTPTALADAYYEKYVPLEDLFEIALQQLTGDILDPSAKIKEYLTQSERAEVFLSAKLSSREALQEFLEREEFWILRRPALFARMRSTLLKAGEIDLLEGYYKKSGIKEFTKEDALCVFTEHIDRWVCNADRDVERLTVELARFAERLHVRIDWQEPKMQEAAKEIFKTICKKFYCLDGIYLEEFRFFIEHTGIDPLYWRPPYDGLLDELKDLEPTLISCGRLDFVDELQKTIKGWRLEESDQKRLVKNAYKNLFDLYFWTEELERPLAAIEQENKEKYESFLAHGGNEIPESALIETAMETLEKDIRTVQGEDQVEAFVLFEALLVRAIHVFHVPIEQFQGRLKQPLEKLFLHERYSRPYFYQERMVIVNRLEKITGVKTPVLADHEKQQCVIEAIQRLQVPYTEKVVYLKPYLDAVLPGLITPMSFDRFQNAAKEGLGGVTRDNVEKLDFIEHYQALKSWHLADTCEKREKNNWIQIKIQMEGLLFDPQEAAFQLDCTPLAFESELGKRWQLHQLAQDEKEGKSEDAFAEQIARIVSNHGVKEALDLLLHQETSSEFKERVLRNLIHTIGLRCLLSQGQVRPPHRREHEIVSLLEAIERLSVSAERKNALVQEIYGTYVARTKQFPDIQLIPGAPAIERDHPIIKRAREMATKACVCDYDDQLNRVVRTQAGVAAEVSQWPAILPCSEWSRELIQAVSKSIHPDFLAELTDSEKKASFRETQEQFEARLLAQFELSATAKVPIQLEQYLLLFPDKIEIACKTNPLFYQKYRLWVALQVGSGQWSFSAFEQRPGLQKQFLSGQESAIVLKQAVEIGLWQTIDALVEHNPAERAHMDAEREAVISLSLPNKAMRGDTSWLIYVINTYPDCIRKVALHGYTFKHDYLNWIKKTYQREPDLLPDFFRNAPELDFNDPEIQYMMAKKAILLCETNSIPTKDIEIVHWQDENVKRLIAQDIKKYFPAHTAFQGVGSVEPMLARLEGMLKITGYKVTDPVFWPLKSLSLSAILSSLKQWRLLEARYGGVAEHQRVVWADAQEGIDERCLSGVENLSDFLALQKQTGLKPSEEAIRMRVLRGLEPYGDINKGIELAKAFNCSIALTPEQIEQIAPKAARTETLIYTILLPQGAQRARAEQAFKARSPLAALIPQFLAIQSPARRSEFCPYEQELQPLLDKLSSPLGREASSKALLFFLKEFGMHNLPRLASAIMALHEFPVTKQWYGRMDAVVELRELVGVPSNEEWKLERYIERIREIAQEVRQSILEDRPLEAAIERSALGMEIFNAIIPHTGSYQDVQDRPQLVAEVRQNRESLRIDPWYKASTKAVNIAEQEKSLTGEEILSPTERAIRVRRDQIEKKFQDETMQRFIGLWESSARMMDLEPTGQSRFYWFSLLKDRWEKQRQGLEKKREGIENPRGIAALTKQIERFEAMQTRITELLSKDEERASSPEALTEELQSLFINSSGKVDRVELEAQAGDVARALSLALMRTHSEAHYLAIKQSRPVAMAEGGLLSPALISAWGAWFQEEYLEHFAGLNGDADVVLSQATRVLLQKLWRIDGLAEDIQKKKANEKEGPIQHPILGCFEQIKSLQQQILRLEREESAQEQGSLEFWPVKGIGRVLAGDIADACYHRHRQTLARGGERKITALLMTIPGQTELAGSTLLIDTRTVSKKRVLVIRALNPTVAILRKSLDATSVVEATIEYAKEVAMATAGSSDPITEIRICYDRSSGHSTNRPEIFAAETQLVTQYKWGTGEALENVTETNFNGYNIHDPQQTRVVWHVKRP